MVATDLSARSDRAMARAFSLAQQFEAELSILTVIDEDLPVSVQDRVKAAAQTEIEDMVSDLAGGDVVKTTVNVVIGKGDIEIGRAAEEADADLVILGSHRNEAGSRPVVGTTMEKVIRQGSRPVLVVINRAKVPYSKALIGVDFSVYSRRAIVGALRLAPDAALHAVHAFHVPFEGLISGGEVRRSVRQEHEEMLADMIDEEMANLISATVDRDGPRKNINKLVRHGHVEGVLRQEVGNLNPDLVVLGTHGRVGVSRALLGSVAESFLNNPPCDVLVVKAW